jgi:hypothetical protein
MSRFSVFDNAMYDTFRKCFLIKNASIIMFFISFNFEY